MSNDATNKNNTRCIVHVKFGETFAKTQGFLSVNEYPALHEAYNEVVVDNYLKVRFVQFVSLLGPCAGTALTIVGVLEEQRLLRYIAGVYSSALLMGPLLWLVSTLTCFAVSALLRSQLMEQLQELCEEHSRDNAMSLELVQRGGWACDIVVTHGEDVEEACLEVHTGVPLDDDDVDELSSPLLATVHRSHCLLDEKHLHTV